MAYRLKADLWGQVFAIPSQLVDQHIKMGSGAAWKVLLLLLRHPDAGLEAGAISQRLGLSGADVSDALNYWLETGVLLSDDTPAAPVKEIPVQQSIAPITVPTPAVVAPAAPQTAAAGLSGARPRFPREEVIALINDDRILASLTQEAQAALGKVLTSADLDVLVGLYSFYRLSPHFILTLLHYCVEIRRASMAYAESVAVSWIKDGIDDSSVDAQVDRLMSRRTNEGRIKTAFGIRDRNLITREKEYIAQWFEQFGFSLEMITMAYEIAVERTGKLAFGYINRILTSWHQKGISTPEQAKAEPKPAQGSGKKQKSSLDEKILEQFINE